MNTTPENDDYITIDPADYDEYYEDEKPIYKVQFDEDDQFYNERLEFHITAFSNRESL